MMSWDSGWAWLWMTMMMVVFWGAVAFVVLAAVRGSGRYVSRGSIPRDILATRFARGEIDADEYAERRRILDGETPAPGLRR